jgi:putative flavoprotein involved in K+ transport
MSNFGSTFEELAASEAEVAVVGGGTAGLAAAAELRRRGLTPVLLERTPGVGASWRGRYDRLRLNTVRWMSGLPGGRIPRSAGRWPARAEFVRYLERYAERQQLDVRTGIAVTRVDRDGDGYRLHTSAGELRSRFVVVATGYDHEPVMPEWPGRERFADRLLHSSEYRNAAPFAGRDVLVVGLGNTGVELVVELLEAGARVRLSMRTSRNILTREMFGLPATVLGRMSESSPDAITDRMGFLLQRMLWGDLERYGIPRAPYGIATELKVKGLGAVVDSGFVAALKQGRVEVVPAVERFDGADVVLSDGARLRPDVVIAATGYRSGLEDLVGHLGVLLPTGRPAINGGRTHPDAPGLYFNGYWLPLSGQIPALRRSSRALARAMARERRKRSRRVSASPRIARRSQFSRSGAGT